MHLVNACPNGLSLLLTLFATVTRFRSLVSMLFLSYFTTFLRHIHDLFNYRHLQMRLSFS
ncbi:hypothetical protein Hanom_Chr05g00410881 [Helianthus anomalus]